MSWRPADYVGLMPAAGRGTRLALVSGSKEVLPLPGVPQRLACDCLLEGFSQAGMTKTHVIIREGKWDIPQQLGDGHSRGLMFAYHLMGLPFGTPFSLAQALPFISGQPVALGFPDIQFRPVNAFSRLIRRHQQTDADIVLGLFPVDKPQKFDMVEADERGRVTAITIKPVETRLTHSWVLAVWNPAFSAFMLDFLASQQLQQKLDGAAELFVGSVFQAALRSGFDIQAEHFDNGAVLDVGTPDDLERAARFFR